MSGSGSLIEDNTLTGNNTAGGSGNSCIAVFGTNNRVDGNHIIGNGAGYGIVCNFGPTQNKHHRQKLRRWKGATTIPSSLETSSAAHQHHGNHHQLKPVGEFFV